MSPNPGVPGEAPACLAEREERRDLADSIGQITKELALIRTDIGEDSKEHLPEADPKRLGSGMKRLLLETKRDIQATRSDVRELRDDFAEIKNSLLPTPEQRDKRLRERIAFFGSIIALVIGLGSIAGGCYAAAASISRHVKVDVMK